MRSKPIYLALLLGGLILLVWALGSFFMFNYPPEQPPTPEVITVVSEVTLQDQAVSTNDWSLLNGLATFDNQIKLLSVELPSLTLSPGSSADPVLLWQTQTPTASYRIFLHLLDDGDNLVAQVDTPLTQQHCSKTSQISSNIRLTCPSLLLPEGLTEGQYQLVVGVYNSPTGQRLTTATSENQFFLAMVEVQALTKPLISAATPLSPCPVTVPNGQTPPGEQPSPDQHGNGQLWTGLWPDGKVIFKPEGPGQILPDGSLTMKWWWWRGVEGQLTIKGRRLDAPAPPLQADLPEGYGETGFQAAGLIFPSTGCWEVTGRVGEAALTFVTLVIKED